MIQASTNLKAVNSHAATDCKNPLRNIKNTYRARVTARIEAYRNADLAKQAAAFTGKARADKTTESYATAMAQYRDFCEENGFSVDPGEVEAVQQFLTFLAIRRGLSMATVELRFAGLVRYYRDKYGRDNVTSMDAVRNCLKGLKRVLGERPKHAEPVTVDKLRLILAALPKTEVGNLTLEGLRDRALLLVIYATGMRRSEAAGILRADVVIESVGVQMLLRSSKTDQIHEGQWLPMMPGRYKRTCPVKALVEWFEVSPGCSHLFHPVSQWGAIKPRPLTDQGIGRIVKRAAARANTGLDWESITAHSLRAGVITDLTSAGLPTALVQERSRHKSANMVSRYHRPTPYKTNFSRKGGL